MSIEEIARPICICGIDPGLSGAIAFYYPRHAGMVSVFDMPTAAKEVDVATLTRLAEQHRPNAAFVEHVSPHPVGGVVAQFKFGAAYGAALGVLGALRVPVRLVRHILWKKHFRLSSDKEKSRALAIRLFPGSSYDFSRKKDEGRAEAALIAKYGAETIITREG